MLSPTVMLELTLPLLVSAHVKLRYSYKNEGPAMAIRNAPGPYADGVFSTSGPCGGANKWGQNGYTNMTDDGSSLTLKISYNGGHQSPANNFRMAFKCVPLGQEIPQAALKRSTGTLISNCPSVPSTKGTIDPPYTVTCNLPKQNLTAGTANRCTVSVLDQRDWGGCNDILLTAAPAPPPPPPADFVLPSSSIGYQIQQNVQTAKVHVNCTEFVGSSLKVRVLPGKGDKVLVTGNLCFTTGTCWENEVTLTKLSGTNAVAFEGRTTVHGEAFQIDYVNNNPDPNLLTFTNVETKSPTVCDGIFRDLDTCLEYGCTSNTCSCIGANAPVSAVGGTFAVITLVLVFITLTVLVIFMFVGILDIPKLISAGKFKLIATIVRGLQVFLSLVTFSAAGHWAITKDGFGDVAFRFLVADSVFVFLTTIAWLALDILKTWNPDTYLKAVQSQRKRAIVELVFDGVWSVIIMLSVLEISLYPGVGRSDPEFLGALASLWFVWFAFIFSLLQQFVVVFIAKEWTEKMDSDTDGNDIVGNDDMASPQTSNPDEETTTADDYGSTMI